MRILFVASFNSGRFAPFVLEQAQALRSCGVECELFGVVGKGLKGYLGNLSLLKGRIRECRPDVVHAHYGLCGLLACLQRRVPVVVTYHGSDINVPSVMRLSRVAMRLAAFNIFVSDKTMAMSPPLRNSALLPCGVNPDAFPELDSCSARVGLGLDPDRRYVLFAGAFNNPVKCPELARDAMKLVPDAEILELKGYDRSGVAAVMAASDALLMTSYSEGSPQVVKEALASGLPVVSVDVGSVKEMTDGLPGCFVVDRNPSALSAALLKAFDAPRYREQGRERLVSQGLVNEQVARRLIGIYDKLG